MTRSIAKVLALVLALTAVAGPVAAGTDEARGVERVRVRIVDNRFRPRNITIEAGTRVKWVNRGSRNHTTTSSGLWNSGSLAPGESFRRRFNQQGTFNYLCTIHSSMTGTITVT